MVNVMKNDQNNRKDKFDERNLKQSKPITYITNNDQILSRITEFDRH